MALATMTVSGAVERHGAGELATGRGTWWWGCLWEVGAVLVTRFRG